MKQLKKFIDHFRPTHHIMIKSWFATTFNVVDENRVFRGGVICPGLSTGLRALGDRCAQLPQVHLGSPSRAIGTHTEQ